jgi:glycosyltransferase involved in cell wall biosynthesis
MNTRVAVITPYLREPLDILRQCRDSVRAQKVAADHFFVADGCPNERLNHWGIKHLILPGAHGDNGNTPRGIGSLLAAAEGYDFIAYLDADNWYHADHLASLRALWDATRADACCSLRTFHALDGRELPVREHDEESLSHVDTSCYLLHRSAFDCLKVWLTMPRQLSPICDRVFLKALLHQRLRLCFTKERTVAFRSQYEVHYLAANMEPPPNAKSSRSNEMGEMLGWLQSPEGASETMDTLGYWPL